MLKINERWIMIKREPGTYALIITVILVSSCAFYGFITIPKEWRCGIEPRLSQIEQQYTKDKIALSEAMAKLNSLTNGEIPEIIQSEVMPSCLIGRKTNEYRDDYIRR